MPKIIFFLLIINKILCKTNILGFVEKKEAFDKKLKEYVTAVTDIKYKNKEDTNKTDNDIKKNFDREHILNMKNLNARKTEYDVENRLILNNVIKLAENERLVSYEILNSKPLAKNDNGIFNWDL